METKLDRLKTVLAVLEKHKNIIEDTAVYIKNEKAVYIGLGTLFIGSPEHDDFVNAIGQEDIDRFGKFIPRTGSNVPDQLEFDITAWLEDHCYSIQDCADWMESVPSREEK